jgi:hypothetical protein
MKRIFFFILIGAAFYACSKSNGGDGGGTMVTPTCTETKSFATDVNPIFQNTCAIAGCHAAGSFNGPGALTTYSQIFNNRAIIRSAVASGTMPKTGSLSTDQKNSLLCWIDSGAPNN